MRLFVSIDFPENILKEIHSWIPDQKGWKKVAIHQMHLTLVFLGDCSKTEKDEIHGKLSEIEFVPFEMAIEGLGVFPNESDPRILWAGVRENDQLIRLQRKISESLAKHIKSNHTNSYIPHITLARIKSGKGRDYAVNQNLQKETGELVSMAESFQLKQSMLKSSGSEHHVIHHYEAKHPQQSGF